jgi:hypothetical protein
VVDVEERDAGDPRSAHFVLYSTERRAPDLLSDPLERLRKPLPKIAVLLEYVLLGLFEQHPRSCVAPRAVCGSSRLEYGRWW